MSKLFNIVALLAVLMLPSLAKAQVTCDNGTPVTVTNVDTATGTTSYFPAYSLYNYSYSEQIIPADSLVGIGDIKALMYKPTNTTSNTYYTNCTIYLANVTVENLSNGFVQDMSQFELVFAGSLNWTDVGWQTIVFDDAFAYDGQSNLLIAILRNHGSWGSSSAFASYTASASLGREIHQDSGPYTIGSISGGSAYTSVAWYKFIGCEGTGDVCYRIRNLQATNITSDGCTLTWVDTLNSGASYTVYDMADSTILGTTSTTSFTVSNLESNTLYHFAVEVSCSSGSTSSMAHLTVRTACGGYTQTPYTTNFDDVTDGEVPPCWTALSTGTSGSGTFPSVYNYSTNSYSSPKYFEFESSTGETEIVALPAMENISQKSFTFYASIHTANFVLEVGVWDGTSFEVVDTVTLATSSNWHDGYYPYTVYFANYYGNGEQIAFRVSAAAGTSYTLMMDDFSVNDFSGCYPVSDLTATAIDSSSITLHWEDDFNGGVTYAVSYWTGTGDTTVEYATDTTITINGLTPNSLYNFSVVASCSSGDATAVEGSWRTECGTTAIPFTEGFEGYTTDIAPSCWNVLSGSPRVMTSVPNTGTKHLYFSGGQPNTIVLPPFNQPTGDLQVRFWTRPESYTSSSCGSFAVGYMTDINVDSTFVQVASYNYSDWTSNTYLEKEVSMLGAPDSARIVLRHNSGATYYYWYVDDLVVEPIPTCAHPVSISASNVTANDADITIVGADGANYRLYWTDGTTTDSADITTNTYSFTNLTGSTFYTVSAATLCDDGSITSTVSTSFVTDCEDGSCDVIVNMTDSYGDGWNGAAVQGFVGTNQVFSATFSSGSNATYTYSLCSSDTLVLKWQTGSYDSETSFQILHGGNPVASGNGNSYSNGAVIGTLAGCPSCSAPSGFVVDSLTSTSATFHWDLGGATEWIVVVNGDSTNAVTTTNNSMSLTGLSANTLYNIAIITVCGTDDNSMPLNVSFRTECGSITTLPWTEDFNSFATTTSATVIPCWDYIGTGGYVNISGSSYSYSGNCLRFYPNSSSSTDHIIKLPIFDTVISGLEMSFYTCPESASSSGSLSVGYVTDSGLFVETLNIPCSMGNTPTLYEATFPNAPVNSRIAMRHNVGSTSWYWFVDEINVHALSSCPKPLHFTLNSVSGDSATVSWNEGGSATTWDIAVGDAGFNPDTVTPVTSYDSTFTVTGLLNAHPYDIYVRADCGTEQSLWVGPIYVVPGQYLMGTSGSDTLHTCGVIVYDNGGAAGQYTASNDFTLVIYPSQPDSILTFHGSFVHESCCDHLYIYEGVGTNGTLLWQDAGATSETIPTDTSIMGPITVHFTSDFSIFNDGLELFVNCIAGPSCIMPTNLMVSSLTSNSATIDWTPVGSESEWEVTCNGTTNIVTTPSAVITGLASPQGYTATVRAICGAGDTSFATYISFSTPCTSVTDFPWVEDFESASTFDCWSQEGDGEWEHGTGDYSSSTGAHSGSYNALITSYGDDYVTKLITPVLELTPGTSATLSFWYVMRSWAGDIDELNVYYRTSLTGSWTLLRTYTGAAAAWTYDTITLPNVSSTYQIAFEHTDNYGYGLGLDSIVVDGVGNGCGMPMVSVSNIDYQSATITAVGGGQNFVLHYGTTPSNLTNTMNSATGSFNVTGLQPATQYYYSVYQECDDSTVSNAYESYFFTDSLGCVAVTGLQVTGTSYNSISVSWTPVGDETAWEIKAASTVDSNTVLVFATQGTVDGLFPQRAYSVTVRPMCGSAHNIEGPWCDPVTANTDICQPVSNVTVSGISATTATVAWTAPEGATNFRVLYGLHDFDVNGEIGSYTTTSNPFALTGLEANTPYTVRVAVACTESLVSAYESADFTTTDVSIFSADNDGALSLYPNPASTTVTLRVSEQFAGSTVTIVDVNGRVVMSEQLNSQTLTLNLSDLAKGAYFVRLTADQATAVRKLIVK